MLNVVADHPGPLPAVTLHARRGGGGAIKKVLLCPFTPKLISSVRYRHRTKLAPRGKPQNSTVTKLSANPSRLILAPIIVAAFKGRENPGNISVCDGAPEVNSPLHASGLCGLADAVSFLLLLSSLTHPTHPTSIINSHSQFQKTSASPSRLGS